jgi:acyl-coenzyme A synthetase/AMP-(fatty) acid ligase
MRGGAKIYPAEIESALGEHPQIIEAAVVGRETASREPEVVAFVVARAALTPGEIVAHCRSRLTPHKVPRQIFLVSRLRKNAAGKIDKRALGRSIAGPETHDDG